MAADNDPESEVFEITDFTTASEWERFVSRVEEVLNEWKLTESYVGKSSPGKGAFVSGSWGEQSHDVHFADFKFHITHHFLKEEEGQQEDGRSEEETLPPAMHDLLCMSNDFPPRAHCLVRWFGLREFVVISPGANCEAIISESKCNLLLSSVSMSLTNSGCQVPMFVQIQQKWRRIYAGECQGPGVRTDFEIVHLRKVPSQYNHLSGLLDIFKSKIVSRGSQTWGDGTVYENHRNHSVRLSRFGSRVSFGSCAAPFSHRRSVYTPGQKVAVLDLDPLEAPHWSVRVRTADNLQCLLGDFITEFFKLCCRKESAEEVLGRSHAEEEGPENSDISSALSKLTEPAAPVPLSKLSVSSMVHSARKHIRRRRHIDESPLNTDVLNSILLFLFPDAAVEKTDREKTTPSNSSRKTDQERSSQDNLFLHLKSAPSDSLTYRLALCLCMVNYSYGGLPAVTHLWQEFVLELRYRWENNYLIYGLAAGPPDLRCCLLHQKLQMLNCCIERKRSRDEARKAQEGSRERERPASGGRASASSTREGSGGKSWDSWSDSEDEFFECLSDQGDMEASQNEGGRDGSKGKAEGRLHPYNNMTLLASAEPLYVPVTQEPAPMTEDQLEEQSEVLAKLGTSAEGTHLRARMQSACLLSDMESFKAANPGCLLEDFVRWYSPRDYVEEEVVDETGQTVLRGELSARMKIPGNMWVEAWDSARVTPARRQKRLFDDTKEAEKVLHYLAMLKPADLAHHLLPCILHAAILKLKQEESLENIPSVEKSLQQATSQANKLLHAANRDHKKVEDFINQLVAMETAIAEARSLQAKFAVDEEEDNEGPAELKRFITSLLEEPEVEVMGAGQARIGRTIHRLFINAQRVSRYPLSGRHAALDLSRVAHWQLGRFCFKRLVLIG
uniref:Rab3 GTPase-activating protein catalytic subunit n=1 Tax=Cyprinodon variegatus TaxID=28743 RepID=A0A3Q2EFP5_CYPVA